MFCVVQEVELRKPNTYGAYKILEVDTISWISNNIHYVKYGYHYTGERFERPVRTAYKISIHKSYRENGKVKKKQYSIATIKYYDLVEYNFCDCIVESHIKDLAKELNITTEELYNCIYDKIDPLADKINKEFKQTEEYKVHQEHKKILEIYQKAKYDFSKKYDINIDEYDYCYNIFGELKNKQYLDKIIQDYNTRSYYKNNYSNYSNKNNNSSYYKSNYSNDDGFSSYLKNNLSNYTEEEKQMLKKFYKTLATKYHPDVNTNTDTTKEMILINKLKNEWDL